MKNYLSILHITNSTFGGGAEKQCILLAKSQQELGHKVYLAINQKKTSTNLLLNKQLKIFYLGNHARYNLLLWVKLFFLQRKLNPDITQSWLPNMDIISGLISRFNKKKFIMTERSSKFAYISKKITDFNEEEIILSYNPNSIKMFIDNTLRYYSASYASAIVANSLPGCEYWKGKLPNKNIYKVNNILQDDLNEFNKSSIQNKSDKLQFLIIGSIESHKSPLIILFAARKLIKKYDLKFTYVGNGSKTKLLKRNIEKFKLQSHISVLPYNSSWSNMITNNTAIIQASYFEGQPNTVLEAIAYKIPIILSDIEAHREILDSSSAYFFILDNVESLIIALEKTINDLNQKNRKKINSAFEKVTSYGEKKITDQYLKIYSKTIN